jgi:hypothetical protein
MHDVHESSFECRFESASRRRVAHVRAWDAKEALQLFEAELRADGIDEPGEFAVSPVRGGRRPAARAHRHHDA